MSIVTDMRKADAKVYDLLKREDFNKFAERHGYGIARQMRFQLAYGDRADKRQSIFNRVAISHARLAIVVSSYNTDQVYHYNRAVGMGIVFG